MDYSLCMKSPHRRTLVVVVVSLLLVALILAAGLWTKRISATAKIGADQVKSGAERLAAMDATAAASDFSAAKTSFDSVTGALGPSWLSAAAGAIPWLGRQYVATRTLARIGSDGSLAGLELAEALRPTISATATPDAANQLGSVLPARLAHVDAAFASLSDALAGADTLPEDGLLPPLADAVRQIQDARRKAAPLLARSRALLELKSYLLSGNHRIIVVSQDGAELRPTGGWAGSFGIVNTGSGGVQLESYKDVFVLPNPSVRVPMPQGALQSKNFNFRNANWWIDFPTSAQRMLAFWSEAGQQPVDGIIVVDTVVMANLIDVVGPITVPLHKEPFTSENLLDQLLLVTQVQKGGQLDRKNVLIELATELEKRVFEASPRDLAKAALVLGKAADEKHVQMYFTDPDAQAAVDALGWSGRVAPPAGTSDVVVISNAMNKPGKVNVAMKKTIDYSVQLQADRSAETTLVLGYANTGPYRESENLPPDFRDWLRVYRMPGTVFPATRPDGSKTTTLTDFGFPAETRMFLVGRGQTHTETLTARVPDALRTAKKSGTAEQYRLYVVRQADLEDIPTSIRVTAPPGWRVAETSARLLASGAPLPAKAEGDRVVLSAPLSGDLVLDIRLEPRK
jgi:hypothetical protein